MTESLLALIVLVPLFSLYKEHSDRGGWYFLNPVNSFWLTFMYAGAIQPALARDEWTAFYGEETLTLTLSMFFMLGLAVHFGYHAAQGALWSRRIPNLSTPSMPKVYWGGFVALAIGLLGYYLVAQASGGFSKWSSAPRRYTDYTLSGYIYTLPRVATLGLMILLCCTWANAKNIPLRIAVMVLAFINLFWQIYSGTREGTILMLIILLGCVYGARWRNPPILAIGATIVAAFFFFGFIPTYRGHFRNLSLNLQETPEEVIERSTQFYKGQGNTKNSGPDLWSDFGMAISIAYYVPSRISFDGGQMLLESVTRPVPRALWPGKSYPEGEAWDRFHRVSGVSEVTNAAGLLSGPSPTMTGKFFYIGGWLGIVIGGYMSGICFRVLWEYLRRHSGNVLAAILAVAMAGLGAMEMIHPLSWSMNFWLPTIGAPFFLFSYLVRLKPDELAKTAEVAPIS